jgi:dipeptidyl aminopeptidase/acylaminoacyl peptidase
MTQIKIAEKYERSGWPSLKRPDVKPPLGWDLSQLVSINRIYNHQLSPDGEKIAFIWNRDGLADVYVMPSAGGWPARFSTNRASTPYWWDEVPQWSPDNQWLAFCIDNHVHITPEPGGLPRKITSFTSQASSPVWMPDSQGLIITIQRETCAKLYLTDREGQSLRMLTSGDGDDLNAQPAPDGSKVAFVHSPRNDPNRWDIRMIDLDSGEVNLLIGNPKQKDWRPHWSPDGKQIAFLSQRSGFNEAWLIEPDGQGLRQLTHLGMDVGWLSWSPDGKRIACTVNHGGAFDLALIDVQTGEISNLSSSEGYFSQINWDPKGDSLTVEYENPLLPPDIYRVSIPDGQKTQLTLSNLPALEVLSLVVPERVSYRSYDGLEIPALLYRPQKSNGAAILYPHGGPTEQYGFGYDLMAQYFVAKGYTYLAPNYRGSTGYGLDYEHANYNNWGVGDTQDCLYGTKYMRTLPGVDPQRIGIMGGSYGGYMVACCLSRDPEYLFACGVSRYGDANLVSSWAQCDPSTRLYTEMQITRPALNRQVYIDGSPIHQAENIQKPVLILHGLEDRVVPPQASEEWVEALRRAGKTFEYKTFSGEPHGFQKRATQLEALERTERFLDWYLMPLMDK